jgi:hypothetical protein
MIMTEYEQRVLIEKLRKEVYRLRAKQYPHIIEIHDVLATMSEFIDQYDLIEDDIGLGPVLREAQTVNRRRPEED